MQQTLNTLAYDSSTPRNCCWHGHQDLHIEKSFRPAGVQSPAQGHYDGQNEEARDPLELVPVRLSYSALNFCHLLVIAVNTSLAPHHFVHEFRWRTAEHISLHLTLVLRWLISLELMTSRSEWWRRRDWLEQEGFFKIYLNARMWDENKVCRCLTPSHHVPLPSVKKPFHSKFLKQAAIFLLSVIFYQKWMFI